jgi:hypothetical protein
VTLNENQITPTVYDAIISASACMDIWTNDVPVKYLNTVKELYILNKHKAQGYVLENPLDTFQEMGKVTPENAKAVLFRILHRLMRQRAALKHKQTQNH